MYNLNFRFDSQKYLIYLKYLNLSKNMSKISRLKHQQGCVALSYLRSLKLKFNYVKSLIPLIHLHLLLLNSGFALHCFLLDIGAHHYLGATVGPKMDVFLEKCRRGGGAISDLKNYISDFVGFKSVYFGKKSAM